MSNIVYLSLVRKPTDGTTTVWEFSFAGGYIDRAYVKARTINVGSGEIVEIPLTAGSFVGPNQIKIEPALPIGLVLEIYRDTPRSAPLVDFVDGSIMNERNLDKNARQAIQAVAEMTDRFEDTNLLAQATSELVNQAVQTSDDAKSIAQAATSTAGQAVQIAQSAVTTANAATATAAEAVQTADTAVSIAEGAVDSAAAANATADGAVTIALDAKAVAEGLEQRIIQSDETANQALTTANGIDDKATQANVAANQALTTANGVDAKATQALNTANTASATANQASQTANQAASTANGIDAKATQALSTAQSAETTASAAESAAAAAVSTANGVDSKADNAVATANQASSTASAAVALAQAAVPKTDIASVKYETSSNKLLTSDKAYGLGPFGLGAVPNYVGDIPTGYYSMTNTADNKPPGTGGFQVAGAYTRINSDRGVWFATETGNTAATRKTLIGVVHGTAVTWKEVFTTENFNPSDYQPALGYTPVNKAGDWMSGSLTTDGNFRAVATVMSGAPWGDGSTTTMLDNGSIWFSNGHNKFRIGRDRDSLYLARYTPTGVPAGQPLTVYSNDVVHFDKRPTALGTKVALKGDWTGWTGDVVQIDLPGEGNLVIYDLPRGYLMMGLIHGTAYGTTTVWGIRGIRSAV